MKYVLCAVLALLLIPESANAQTPVSGYAISLDTGEPISETEIVLKDVRGLAIEGLEAVSAASDGRFAFEAVEPGSYTLHATARFADGSGQVLVTKQFEVLEAGEEIYLGFSQNSMRIAWELGSAIQNAPTTQETPRSPVRYELEGAELLLAQSRLLQPKVVTKNGMDILNTAYPAE